MDKQYAILLLAGDSSRRKEKEKKQFILLGKKERFLYSLDTFFSCSFFTKIVLVIKKEDEEHVKQRTSSYPKGRILFAYGGKDRSESVRNGLKRLDEELEEHSFVFIHDGDRPFVSKELLFQLKEKEKEADAITLIDPVYDSILRKKGESIAYVDRKNVYLVQTPQVFSSAILKEILNEKKSATDDFQLALAKGFKTAFILGEKKNFKITDSKDLERAEMLSFAKENKQD